MKYASKSGIIPWQPSTWPEPPKEFDSEFVEFIGVIFKETILGELENVVHDILKSHGGLEHRGHVVAIGLLCSIDAVSSYGYHDVSATKCPECGRSDRVEPRYVGFIESHFPSEYRPYAKALYKLYRNSMIHSWNLFEVAIYPGDESIRTENGSISFGLIHFWEALKSAVGDFLSRLETDRTLQGRTLARYADLRASAKP